MVFTSMNKLIICCATFLILVGCRRQKPDSHLANVTPPGKADSTPRPVRYHLYIPTNQGRLILRVEEDPHLLLMRHSIGEPTYLLSQKAATEAVKRLLKAAPEKFPPGTKIVGGVYNRGGYPTLNFNRAFANAMWWNVPRRGKAAIYAIVNTAIQTKENTYAMSDATSLTIRVDDKPVTQLGKLDLREPIGPDMHLVLM